MDTELRVRRTAIALVLFGLFSSAVTMELLALVLRHIGVASGGLLLIGSSVAGLCALRPHRLPRTRSGPPWHARSRRRCGTARWMRYRCARTPSPTAMRGPARVQIAVPQTPAPPVPIARQVAAVAAHLPDLPTNDVIGLLHHGRHQTIHWSPSLSVTAARRRQIAAPLQLFTRDIRWHGAAAQLRDITIPVDAPTTPCVPMLRVSRSVVWWPLAHSQHLLVAGAGLATVALQIATLHRHTPEYPPLVLDPDRQLATLDGYDIPATPNALALMQRHSQQALWHTHTGIPLDMPAQQVVVIAPDAALWREVLPLLRATGTAVQCIVLLGTTLPDAVRDVCHRVPVVWIGSAAHAPLPEAFRPAQLHPPRPGQAVAWWQGRTLWSGHALRWDAATQRQILGESTAPDTKQAW